MRTRFATTFATVAAGLATTLSLTACGSAADGTSGKPSVVASTNVWGDIAATVAGPDAAVESIITDPAADPHSHETSAVESAKIMDADLVVYNGGGYDEFMEKAVAGKDKRAVDAFASRADDIRDDDNEHVWYDVDTVAVVADKIAAALGEIDPEHATAYTDRAAALRDQLNSIRSYTTPFATSDPGTPIMQTEPLAHYLLLDAGTEDLTPREYQEAIEQETDPAPAAVAAARDLVTNKQVRLMVYNVQTEDKTSKELRAQAEAAGIPVVEVTETLPAGVDYVTWQTANARAIASAVD
ncbi:zinc ABC transporter solute-binding protein [Nocardia cyriacigeorgica]|uniref:Zinc ABC transporter solute-binding protein n=1 Tax=Nocardia cyriacigeorgica TaxID=135487 RepID=A0A6P1D317_9NOCA|nr:zinc ABC transporter substrate-binding protein [Nocardia cyriacigeorgica]NEW42101.1 zinc ABC transporter solute-binding protein [Nocardia cyriacigeorgica]NEW44857.1 zinc ABC transporter solute-binding protein [Nocardia cyriacigeorgica]NEW53093.1 zinc ABC transporter solute-binding protein [Nocardia cyriacigeorgica]NEW57138.1 zinc ABC transporter solute-binding protein [Nocardia cyriacigeorgica]